VTDPSAVQIKQTSEHLVHVAFGLDGREILYFEELIEILVECLHGNIEVVIFALLESIGRIGFDDEWTVHHL